MTKKYIYAAYKIVIRTLKTCFVYVLTWGSFLQISCNLDFPAPFFKKWTLDRIRAMLTTSPSSPLSDDVIYGDSHSSIIGAKLVL